ncbi:MAG TPA: ECF-type sigma factor [Steroidobacteraceae bacterium]|nr:ECF-type sigma factor [Steroidobacteraceae bacterium]
MLKRISMPHEQRYDDAQSAIVEALERMLATRSGRQLRRTPLGLGALRDLHDRLFAGQESDVGAFVLHVAPIIRRLAMQAAERQAMVEPVQLRLVDLEQWLRRLDELDPDCVRVIELRYFAGLTIREVAETLGTHGPEILGQLRFAKAWLQARVRWSTRPLQ